MISVNLQREIFNNAKEILDEYLEKETEKLSKEYVGKYICARSIFAENFMYMGKCLGVNIEFKYTKNCDSAQKMFNIILIMDKPNKHGDTSLDLTGLYIHSFEGFDSKEGALLYCEVEK